MFLFLSILNTATAQPLSKAQKTVVCMFPHWNWQLEEVRMHKKKKDFIFAAIPSVPLYRLQVLKLGIASPPGEVHQISDYLKLIASFVSKDTAIPKTVR